MRPGGGGLLARWLARRAGPGGTASRRRQAAGALGSEFRAADPGPSAAPVTVPPGVERLEDLAYGPHPRQRVDVYRPVLRPGTAAGSAPLIAFLHGGGWRRGDKAIGRMVAAKVAHWVAGQGAAFVALNTRLLPEAGVREQAEDLAAAIGFVQREAAAWGADGAALALVGHSAGAHLVALVTADAGLCRAQRAGPWRASVVIDTAALDVPALMRRPRFALHGAAFGEDPAGWAAVSPVDRVRAGGVGDAARAPVLVVQSTLREDVDAPAAAFVDAVRSSGGRAERLRVPLGHRALNDALGEPGAYTSAVDAFLAACGWGVARAGKPPASGPERAA